MFDSREDAWLLRAIQGVVGNAIADNRPLFALGALRRLFDTLAARCPSAMSQITAPDWEAAEALTKTPARVKAAAQDAPRDSEPGQPVLSQDTILRMEKAAAEFGSKELQQTLNSISGLVSFQDLDRAAKGVIDTLASSLGTRFSEEIRKPSGSLILTSYLVGRALMGTERVAFHYSTPRTELENAGFLYDRVTSEDNWVYLEGLGPTPSLYVALQTETLSGSGPFSYLPAETAKNLITAATTAGIVLAIAEQDEFGPK
jgi:hypothetical protein